ncbi:Electron transport complex protein rnfE [Phocoenobacter uteri]|uniref:Ion-translocating oxidoreductase complex subunit E n=1 Tax=Phocoenobacter uteri TaxID=146806 RepID=A0A379CBE4_9PAST|nr:electron transport complex subunit E [Phocoenobacter uteri]SUB59574.1 Electron transport complex protein rnfE [Phocoenobacter uteri]
MTNNQIPIKQIEESPQQPSEWKTLFSEGVWKNNGVLVQLLGLCPLLAVSNSVTNALGLGIATLIVLMCTNILVSLLRNITPHDIRIPIYVMIIASMVTAIQLLMNAFTYPLYQSLGIFIPLIVTNCIVIGRAEAYASKNSVINSAFDGFSMGLGMTLVLVILGAMRELIGKGTLFDGIELLLGDWAAVLRIDVLHLENGLLLTILPPGAFIGLGILLALKNCWDNKR